METRKKLQVPGCSEPGCSEPGCSELQIDLRIGGDNRVKGARLLDLPNGETVVILPEDGLTKADGNERLADLDLLRPFETLGERLARKRRPR